jgi:hypothetical protein
MQYALAAMLQSPSFLYLIAYGESDPDSGALRFTNHELASRLSYFLWDSTPDEALLRQADAGELTTAAGRSAAVARMLDGERGEALAGRFFEEHWHINQTEGNDKDPQRFADWSAELWDAYKRELALTLHDITVSRDADLREVFTGRESFLNARLAQIYGAAQLAGDAFQKTALPDNRHGLLTSGALLSTTSPSGRTSPTQRGVFALEYVLCQELPPPPPGVSTDQVTQPDPDAFRTNRARLEEHRVNPTTQHLRSALRRCRKATATCSTAA